VYCCACCMHVCAHTWHLPFPRSSLLVHTASSITRHPPHPQPAPCVLCCRCAIESFHHPSRRHVCSASRRGVHVWHKAGSCGLWRHHSTVVAGELSSKHQQDPSKNFGHSLHCCHRYKCRLSSEHCHLQHIGQPEVGCRQHWSAVATQCDGLVPRHRRWKPGCWRPACAQHLQWFSTFSGLLSTCCRWVSAMRLFSIRLSLAPAGTAVVCLLVHSAVYAFLCLHVLSQH
jgi:hypothetical protein